jgi:translation initiation factor RLI1
MPKPTVSLDYHRCQVDRCPGGVCPAAARCPRAILRQEAAFELPDIHPSLCRGCALCVPACPFGAIQVR